MKSEQLGDVVEDISDEETEDTKMFRSRLQMMA